MGSTVKVAIAVLLSLVLLPAAFSRDGLSADSSMDETVAAIRIRLRTMDIRKPILHSLPEMKNFYSRRGFRPVWIDRERPLPVATSLLNVLRKASDHGLRPVEYHLAPIESGISATGLKDGDSLSVEELIDLEFLLTDAFFLYASHLASGRVDAEKVDAWFLKKRTRPDLPSILRQALKSGKIESTLESLAPSNPAYARLKTALREYRQIERRGGWPVIPAGVPLGKGDRDERVPLLRERLDVSGVVPFWEDREKEEGRDLYDESVEQAVKAFQRRHGLIADGVLGSATLEALNVPAGERARQIEVNLERLRWMPDHLGDPLVVVNIPQFRLRVLEKGQEVLTSRIVVGKYAQNTPVFGSRITHLILNPYWHVPRSIAVEEILPQIIKNPEYLNWEEMKVLRGSGESTRIVPLWTVDWEKMTARNFNYQLRQDPGPRNPLGNIKFFFPNPYDIYLHDTPHRHLFKQKERNFSHGCIRVEKPVELAVALLRKNPEQSRNELLSAIETGKRRQIRLPQPVGIVILYFTAWVEADGTVQFRRDIYNHDPPLRKALDKDVAS